MGRGTPRHRSKSDTSKSEAFFCLEILRPQTLRSADFRSSAGSLRAYRSHGLETRVTSSDIPGTV